MINRGIRLSCSGELVSQTLDLKLLEILGQGVWMWSKKTMLKSDKTNFNAKLFRVDNQPSLRLSGGIVMMIGSSTHIITDKPK